MKDFSVLITVYDKENPEYFKEALESIINQTLMPSQVVVVKDGPLTKELDEVLGYFMKAHPDLFTALVFDKQIGRGEALRRGVERCKFGIIAIMDSDDISCSDRFKKEADFLENNSEIDIVGSFAFEFMDKESNIWGRRNLPTEHEDIVRFAKKRMPVNHVTIMFKRDVILRAGNYENLFGFEDYYLMVRAIKSGSRLANIPEYLAKVRISDDMFRRRGGFRYLLNEIEAQKKFLAIGFLSYPEFLSNIFMKSIVRLMPNFARKHFYKAFLRKDYPAGESR
ncbi:MAG: glycosyltransferase [Candidatus Omnitrophica bacterium]|nr:glycosyltransferase [Candidatus Omnitrophota bacterium]